MHAQVQAGLTQHERQLTHRVEGPSAHHARIGTRVDRHRNFLQPVEFLKQSHAICTSGLIFLDQQALTASTCQQNIDTAFEQLLAKVVVAQNFDQRALEVRHFETHHFGVLHGPRLSNKETVKWSMQRTKMMREGSMWAPAVSSSSLM